MTTRPIPIPLDRRAERIDLAVRLERLGAEACADEELLAVVLGPGTTARRTARRLIDRFGTLADVMRADPAELRVAGLPPATTPRLAASLEIGRRVARQPVHGSWMVRTPADAAEPLIDAMGSLEREELRVLLLDTKNVVVAERTVYRGNLAGSSVRVGEVYRDAVRRCAAAIVVAHNHPSGDPSPSGEDLRITAELADAGRLLDIELLDHLVIGRGRWTSLRAIGAIGQEEAAPMR
ncbi:MAG TPA: DNA repair protein RadC [Candidatus Limnocylindria bacterium]